MIQDIKYFGGFIWPKREFSSLAVANFSRGSHDPMALSNPPPARIASLSPLKGAYPLQTTPDISEFLRNSEMSCYVTAFGIS